MGMGLALVHHHVAALERAPHACAEPGRSISHGGWGMRGRFGRRCGWDPVLRAGGFVTAALGGLRDSFDLVQPRPVVGRPAPWQ